MTAATTVTMIKVSLAMIVSAAVVFEDLRYRRIPNALCGILLLMGTLSAILCRGWSGLADGLLGAATAFLVFLIPYGLGGLGGGDVKLMAGFGALTGLRGVAPALILVALAGTATAIVYLVGCRLRRKAVPVAIPYAPAIVVGSLLVAVSQMGGK